MPEKNMINQYMSELLDECLQTCLQTRLQTRQPGLILDTVVTWNPPTPNHDHKLFSYL